MRTLHLCKNGEVNGPSLLLPEHAELNHAGVCTRYCLAGNLVLCRTPFAQPLVFTIHTDGVLVRNAVCRGRFQNRAQMVSLESLDEAVSRRDSRTFTINVTVCLDKTVFGATWLVFQKAITAGTTNYSE